MTIQVQAAPSTISLKKISKELKIDWTKMPQASVEHIFAYGIRQILNDAMASAKTDAEALAGANKRLDNLMSGTLRASPVREGNPVRRRALELALAVVIKHPQFIAMCQKAGIKVTHKDALAKANAQAKKWVDTEGNKYTAQAEKDVAAQRELSTDDLDLDLGAFGDEAAPAASKPDDNAE